MRRMVRRIARILAFAALLATGVSSAACHGSLGLVVTPSMLETESAYDRGMEAYREENWEDAAEYLAEVSDDHDNYIKARTRLAVAQAELGDRKKAATTMYGAYQTDERSLWDYQDEVQRMGILHRQSRDVSKISTALPLAAVEIHGDTMFATTRKHVISAWNLRTGKLIWEQSLGDLRGDPELPSVCDGKAFAVADKRGRSSSLVAIDVRTGARAWKIDSLGGISEEMNTVCADGRVYASFNRKGDEKIAAFDTGTGRLVDKTAVADGGSDLLQLGLAGNLVCGHTDEGGVYCVDRGSGAVAFERKLRELAESSPIVGTSESIYVPAQERVYAFNIGAETPMKWKYGVDYKQSGLTLDTDRNLLYLTGGEERALKAISTRTGNEKWSVRPPGVSISVEQPPRLTDEGTVLAANETGVFAVDPDARRLLWYSGLEGAAGVVPDVRNGVVYSPNHDDPENRIVGWKPTSWPTPSPRKEKDGGDGKGDQKKHADR